MNNKQQKLQTKLSVIKLFAVANGANVITTLLATLAVEVAIFWFIGLQSKPEFIEAAIYQVRIPLYMLMAVSFVLLCFILSNTLTGKVGKPIYTIQRLRVTEKEFFKLNWIYNTIVFLTYVGFQALAILLMILIYNQSGCGNGGPQNIMMALYRTPFFHSVVPMENWLLVVRNICYIWSLGVVTAFKSQKSREGEAVYGFYFVAIYVALTFIYDPMNTGMISIRVRDLIGSIISVSVAGSAILSGSMHRERKWEKDEFEASIAEYKLQDE